MPFNFRAFLEGDDEEEKKKKSDEDEDEDDDLDDDDDDDDDSDDDSSDDSTDNDYLGGADDDESGSNDDDDSDSGSTDNDYLGGDDGVGGIEGDNDDISSGDSDTGDTGAFDKLAKVVYATIVGINNFRHIHFHCSGPHFRDIHALTDGIYSQFVWFIDGLAELALQGKGVKLDNFCNSHQYVAEIDIETESDYNFEAACTACANTLNHLLNVYKDARDAFTDRSDIQGGLDEKISFINKHLNYSLERRLSGSGGSVEESCNFFNFDVK